MIIITGGAGFIGSNLLKALNDKNLNDILVVEELDRFEKKFNNLENMSFIDCIDKNKFLNELKSGKLSEECTNTLEQTCEKIKENLTI